MSEPDEDLRAEYEREVYNAEKRPLIWWVVGIGALILLFVVFGLNGCGPKDQEAVFVEYETVGTGQFEPQQQQPSLGGVNTLGHIAAVPREIMRPTGNAVVMVDDLAVVANCPIKGLGNNQAVLVRQNDDGTWIVVGRPTPEFEK